MKYRNKSLALVLIISVIFLFSGCNSINFRTFKDNGETRNNIENNEDNDNINDDKTDVTDNTESSSAQETDVLNQNVGSKTNASTDINNPSPTIVQPTENVELLIYIVDSSAQLEAVPALVPADKDITPQLIVDTVVDSMADRSILIGVESVTTQNDTVIVSFYSDQPPLKDVGASFETAILDAIAQSLVENLKDYNKVIYHVEGGPYISGHLEFGKDEVYVEVKK
ncbi:MAG TPA: hypothetical protein PK304_08460 [Mobilitalea sp.]|nr:hypothetical protein [Mobilitalea sp.]